MLSTESLGELRSAWLPHIPDCALDRLIELLDKNSPLLISGAFLRAIPQGCLATHIAWAHPETTHLTVDAGIAWLGRVAKINPATSHVIREWDMRGPHDLGLRRALIAEFDAERRARASKRHATPCLVLA